MREEADCCDETNHTETCRYRRFDGQVKTVHEDRHRQHASTAAEEAKHETHEKSESRADCGHRQFNLLARKTAASRAAVDARFVRAQGAVVKAELTFDASALPAASFTPVVTVAV
jgi:hypothetical protein